MAAPARPRFTDGFYDVEWRVKGIWNARLVRIWQPAPWALGGWYLVSPEAYPDPANDTQGHRADLIVSAVIGAGPPWVSNLAPSPLLSLEAKGAAGHSFTMILDQIETWCAAAPGIGVGFPCWCVGARGRYVRFWLYSVGPGNVTGHAMLPVHFNAGGMFIDHGGNPDVIGCEVEWDSVASDQVLQMMFLHPYATVAGFVAAGIGAPGVFVAPNGLAY